MESKLDEPNIADGDKIVQQTALMFSMRYQIEEIKNQLSAGFYRF